MIISIIGLVAFAVGAYELLAWAFYVRKKAIHMSQRVFLDLTDRWWVILHLGTSKRP